MVGVRTRRAVTFQGVGGRRVPVLMTLQHFSLFFPLVLPKHEASDFDGVPVSPNL